MLCKVNLSKVKKYIFLAQLGREAFHADKDQKLRLEPWAPSGRVMLRQGPKQIHSVNSVSQSRQAGGEWGEWPGARGGRAGGMCLRSVRDELAPLSPSP